MKIKECLTQFNYLLSVLAKMDILKDEKQGLEAIEDEHISFIPLSDNQSIYLSRLNVELNAFIRDIDKWVAKVKMAHE
ncbi:MAG: hypothetical protein IT256_07450 [Chitinophagaceae bacterium]|nr:hypothetical protein [Chitinophagaceae bacterium]